MPALFYRALRSRRATVLVAVSSIIPPLLAVFLCAMAVITARAQDTTHNTTVGIPYAKEIEHISRQGIEYWFIALAVLAIVSWSFIVKWLINQLESQRAAHAAITDRLINYMQEDHAKMVGLMEGTTKAIDHLNHLVEKLATPRH